MKVSGIDRMTSRQMCVVTLSQRESRISVAAYKPMPECGILILRANLTQQFQTFPTKFYCRDELKRRDALYGLRRRPKPLELVAMTFSPGQFGELQLIVKVSPDVKAHSI